MNYTPLLQNKNLGYSHRVDIDVCSSLLFDLSPCKFNHFPPKESHQSLRNLHRQDVVNLLGSCEIVSDDDIFDVFRDIEWEDLNSNSFEEMSSAYSYQQDYPEFSSTGNSGLSASRVKVSGKENISENIQCPRGQKKLSKREGKMLRFSSVNREDKSRKIHGENSCLAIDLDTSYDFCLQSCADVLNESCKAIQKASSTRSPLALLRTDL